jgi:hypothetical protein
MSVKTRGIKELLRKQNELTRLFRSDDVVDWLVAAVKPVQVRAKYLAPYVTHNLRTSIDTEGERLSNSVVMARVGTNVEYARRIELGFAPGLPFSKGGIDSLGRQYNQVGKPYLSPAAQIEKPRIGKRLGKHTAAAIKRIAR